MSKSLWTLDKLEAGRFAPLTETPVPLTAAIAMRDEANTLAGRQFAFLHVATDVHEEEYAAWFGRNMRAPG